MAYTDNKKAIHNIYFYNSFEIMTEENKEETTNTSDDEVDAGEWWTIEDTKEQLAEMYLNFLDQQKWGILATGASLGVNLNPLKKGAMKYLLASGDEDEEKEGIFSTIGKNIKKKVMEKISWWALDATQGMSIAYDKVKLWKMKALIIANKNNQAELENLMVQIQSGIDPTMTESDNDNPVTEIPVTDILPVYTTYKALKVGEYISQDEITYVNENAKSIVEDLETKWDLSEIKEIKDKDGNIVLKCRGETPYIHSKAAADLIGLALLYHKKTGQNILLESAYRTIAHQARLKKENAAKGTPTADPWYSWHNLWYSIDVSTATRYANKIGWIDGAKKLAKLFNFNPISSEDRHFDYKDFVDKYYDDREARLPEAQKLDKLFSDEQEPVSAAA